MAMRRAVFAFVLGVLPSFGASYRTQNFLVEAPTAQIAERIGQAAEHYRHEKAMEWLGQDMPPWPQPCPLKATVTMGGAGGETRFQFDNGRVLSQQMFIEGSLERLLASVLPHEITHTVFAYYFRQPVPRWADEGGAVLSEDDVERDRHDKLVRNILNNNRQMPLRRLFSLRDYPGDVMVLYAQGFSVSSFLVNASSKPAFLRFVAQGMQGRGGWDQAVQANYGYRGVDDLEQAWLTQLRNTRRAPMQLADNAHNSNGESTRLAARQNLPTLSAPQPIIRGQAPSNEMETEGSFRSAPARAQGPAYLPDYDPSQRARPQTDAPHPSGTYGWQPVAPPGGQPPLVRLGPPQYESPPPAPFAGNPYPGWDAPTGSPR